VESDEDTGHHETFGRLGKGGDTAEYGGNKHENRDDDHPLLPVTGRVTGIELLVL